MKIVGRFVKFMSKYYDGEDKPKNNLGLINWEEDSKLKPEDPVFTVAPTYISIKLLQEIVEVTQQYTYNEEFDSWVEEPYVMLFFKDSFPMEVQGQVEEVIKFISNI